MRIQLIFNFPSLSTDVWKHTDLFVLILANSVLHQLANRWPKADYSNQRMFCHRNESADYSGCLFGLRKAELGENSFLTVLALGDGM